MSFLSSCLVTALVLDPVLNLLSLQNKFYLLVNLDIQSAFLASSLLALRLAKWRRETFLIEFSALQRFWGLKMEVTVLEALEKVTW